MAQARRRALVLDAGHGGDAELVDDTTANGVHRLQRFFCMVLEVAEGHVVAHVPKRHVGGVGISEVEHLVDAQDHPALHEGCHQPPRANAACPRDHCCVRECGEVVNVFGVGGRLVLEAGDVVVVQESSDAVDDVCLGERLQVANELLGGVRRVREGCRCRRWCGAEEKLSDPLKGLPRGSGVLKDLRRHCLVDVLRLALLLLERGVQQLPCRRELRLECLPLVGDSDPCTANGLGERLQRFGAFLWRRAAARRQKGGAKIVHAQAHVGHRVDGHVAHGRRERRGQRQVEHEVTKDVDAAAVKARRPPAHWQSVGRVHEEVGRVRSKREEGGQPRGGQQPEAPEVGEALLAARGKERRAEPGCEQVVVLSIASAPLARLVRLRVAVNVEDFECGRLHELCRFWLLGGVGLPLPVTAVHAPVLLCVAAHGAIEEPHGICVLAQDPRRLARVAHAAHLLPRLLQALDIVVGDSYQPLFELCAGNLTLFARGGGILLVLVDELHGFQDLDEGLLERRVEGDAIKGPVVDVAGARLHDAVHEGDAFPRLGRRRRWGLGPIPGLALGLALALGHHAVVVVVVVCHRSPRAAPWPAARRAVRCVTASRKAVSHS